MHLEYNKIETIKSDFADNNPCVYKPGANATLYVFLDGTFFSAHMCSLA